MPNRTNKAKNSVDDDNSVAPNSSK